MNTVTNITYADAETRGRLRHWKRKLAERYAIFDAVYANRMKYAPAVVDLVKGSRVIRSKAVDKLTKLFGPGATLEWTKLDRHEAVAVWSILKPRESVMVKGAEWESDGERASREQDCVTVNYIAAGTRNLIIAEGLWTMEVPDHALGRAVERSQFLQPEAIIREAHLNLLNMPLRVKGVEPSPYIKAGPGCFVGAIQIGNDVKVGAAAHVRVKTWLEDSMLGPDQVPLCIRGEPGKRMGDTLLLPRPLWPGGGGLQ